MAPTMPVRFSTRSENFARATWACLRAAGAHWLWFDAILVEVVLYDADAIGSYAFRCLLI